MFIAVILLIYSLLMLKG